MNEAATMLNGEARRAASILHQTPGWRWRWRRKLCLTERSQQRQSGPTTKAWRRLPARQRHDACETPSEHLRETVPKLEGNACRRGQRWTRARHRPGTCREHCQSCIERMARAGGTARRVRVAPPEQDPRWSGQHCFKELGRQRSCNAKRHAGSTAWRRADGSVWTIAGSSARKRHLDEFGNPH